MTPETFAIIMGIIGLPTAILTAYQQYVIQTGKMCKNCAYKKHYEQEFKIIEQ